VVLFDGFETLDAFGPVEVIGRIDANIEFYSQNGGLVKSAQGVRVDTRPLGRLKDPGILFIPGGFGVRTEINNPELIKQITDLSKKAEYVLTVCTGSALLARTGLIKGCPATTNKISFTWVAEQDPDVIWVKQARWVKDGKYYTSSGISAGIDMTLDFVRDIMGGEVAQNIAIIMEYVWSDDKNNDPFCQV